MLVEQRIPKMKILRRDQNPKMTGFAVVIDVLRAFTTAAYAFGSGAAKVILVSKADEAKELAKAIPGALTMGEEGGLPIKGFDFDNSPWSFSGLDLTGRTLIQRTSSGTQGVLQCNHCDKILVSSFVVAEATLSRIHALGPKEISFLVTGDKDGSEDEALAEYLQEHLKGDFEGSTAPFLRKAAASPAAHQAKMHHGDYPLSDLDAALALDAFPFALEVFREKGLMMIQPVRSNGMLWR